MILPIILFVLMALGSYAVIHYNLLASVPYLNKTGNVTDVAHNISSSNVATTGKTFAVACQESLDKVVAHFGVDPHNFWFFLVLIIIGAVLLYARAGILSKLLALVVIGFGILMLFI